MGDKLKAIKCKAYYIPITTNRTNGASVELDHHKFLSSKHTTEKELACSSCKRKFTVPTEITTYRCWECQGVSKLISGYKQLRENSLGAKLLNQDQLRNAVGYSSSSFSTATIGNKRAVLCGVSYSRRQYRLKGTVNDVLNMKSLLVENFAFPIQSIRVLTVAAGKGGIIIPPAQNLLLNVQTVEQPFASVLVKIVSWLLILQLLEEKR